MMFDGTAEPWPSAERDLPFEVEALLEMSQDEARRRLQLSLTRFRALCASGRLLPVRVENGQGMFARHDVLGIHRLLERARRIESARRVHDVRVSERAKTWSSHLRHEAALVRASAAEGEAADCETLSSALEAAARIIEGTVETVGSE